MQAVQTMLWNFDQPLSYIDVLRAVGESGNWVSRRMVAERLRRAKSPSLVAKLNDLVNDGFLCCEDRRLPNGVGMLVYSITEKGTTWLLMDASGE